MPSGASDAGARLNRILVDHVAVFVTSVCLVLFWLSAFLPRADGSLLGSDGTHYFAYLPSVILDGDLDFANDYQVLLAGEPQKLDEYLNTLTPTGRPANVWSIGPAILWSPFYLATHGVMLALSSLDLPVQADGYGYPYQLVVLSSNIVLAGIGLLLIQRAVGHVVARKESIAAGLLVVTFGGNLVYYMTVEPHMSHATSVLGVGILSWLWLSYRDRADPVHGTKLGATAGLMALVRPQDGLFLALPYLDRLLRAFRVTPGPRLVQLTRGAVVSATVALIVFSPQLFVWLKLWGSIGSPYALRGEEFYWFDPALFEVLLSTRRGLFVWHPVFLFAVIGLIVLGRRDRFLAWTSLIGFAIQWYLIASWWAWEQGKSFGGRMFIVCTPLFIIGIAALWDRLIDLDRRSFGIWGSTALLAANFALIPLYVLDW